MEAVNLLESKPIQFTGKSLFVIGFIGGALNLISRMELLQSTIVIISGVLGVIFMVYKLRIIRIDLIERNEKRIAAGKKPIRFRKLRLWKRKSSSER